MEHLFLFFTKLLRKINSNLLLSSCSNQLSLKCWIKLNLSALVSLNFFEISLVASKLIIRILERILIRKLLDWKGLSVQSLFYTIFSILRGLLNSLFPFWRTAFLFNFIFKPLNTFAHHNRQIGIWPYFFDLQIFRQWSMLVILYCILNIKSLRQSII